MNNKPKGPRTPQGRARSAKNAMKHKFFVGRILPEEKKQASLFFDAFHQELQPKGALELEIIGDIVLNRLQKGRIDKYIAFEFEKSRTHTIDNYLEKQEREMALYWCRRSINSGCWFQ